LHRGIDVVQGRPAALVRVLSSGRLRLDDHISLEEINDGFAAMQRGEGVRHVVVFD
jgi:Zn-dependent alcohol dehydrogenase